jgi:hypothetical protein
MSDTEGRKPRLGDVQILRLAGLAALVLLACRVVSLEPNAVAEAEQCWTEGGVTDYRIQLREVQGTWCYYDIEVEVRADRVVTGTATAHLGPARGCWAYTEGVVEEPVSLSPDEAARWTVPGLFEIAHDLDSLAGRKDMKVVLEFDPALGFPTRLFRDNTVAMDDEEGLSVVQFERLGP